MSRASVIAALEPVSKLRGLSQFCGVLAAKWGCPLLRAVLKPVLVLVSIAPGALIAADVTQDERHLQTLRERRLFDEAEKYCLDRLADVKLLDARRAELTIELSRTWAEQALASPPEARPPLWHKARQTVEDFVASYPRHPRLLLVRVQGALAALAEGEAASQEFEPAGQSKRPPQRAAAVLRGAIAELRTLDDDIAADLKRQARARRPDDDLQLSVEQLMSLQLHVRHQWARGLRDQALCYPPGSADRVNALTQATELLKTLAGQELNTPLAWSSRLDEIACWRLLEKYEAAERQLAELEQAGPPAEIVAKIRAERIQLVLARGHVDEALSEFDRAAERAWDEHEPNQAFENAYAAATIESQRHHDRAAADRYRTLAIALPDHPQAAEAHLLAIHSAAQQAQQQQPPKLDQYEQLLREHVATWPKSPTASQAWWWLGRLKEHEHAWQEAARALCHVQADHPQYAQAVEAAGRCYDAQLAEFRHAGNANRPLAQEAVRYFQQVIAPAGKTLESPNAATRAAVLAAARIELWAIPRGPARAEALLSGALQTDVDAPPQWRTAASTLLVATLAAQGRTTEAEARLAKIAIGGAADVAALVDLLAELSARIPADKKQKLAQLELAAIDDLLAKRDELDAARLQNAGRLRASALAELGRRPEAIAELESLAKQFPRDGQTQEALATLLASGGDTASLKAALAQWRDVATKSRPGSPRWFRAHYGLARAQLDLGHADQARATLERIESSHPDLGTAEMKARWRQLLAECEQAAPQVTRPKQKK